LANGVFCERVDSDLCAAMVLKKATASGGRYKRRLHKADTKVKGKGTGLKTRRYRCHCKT
jgi:hypothetical protein